jgi:hypothetical protein
MHVCVYVWLCICLTLTKTPCEVREIGDEVDANRNAILFSTGPSKTQQKHHKFHVESSRSEWRKRSTSYVTFKMYSKNFTLVWKVAHSWCLCKGASDSTTTETISISVTLERLRKERVRGFRHHPSLAIVAPPLSTRTVTI